MKHNFMNKKNGKIASVLVTYWDDDGHMQTDGYDKVEDLMADYGAYKPTKPEPLIKDPKIRKAVRAWAEVVPSAQVRYDHNDGRFYTHSEYIQPYSISFPIRLGLEEMTDYTIAELCGEEEE